MSSKPAYRTISMKTEFVDYLEQFIKTNPQYGYRSLAQFLEDSSRRRLEDLNTQQTQFPRMIRINANDNGIRVWDNKIRREVEVLFKPTGVSCSIDGTSDCEHVSFALTQSDVQATIKKKRKEGWKLDI